jgi:hypothetical protein
MTLLKYANLALRFILELCALVALAFWGFQTGGGWLGKIILGIGIPVLAAFAWGTFRVPNDPGKAPVPVPGPFRLLLELAVFGLATAGLIAAGRPSLAWVFGLAVVINYALLYDRLVWLLRQK